MNDPQLTPEEIKYLKRFIRETQFTTEEMHYFKIKLRGKYRSVKYGWVGTLIFLLILFIALYVVPHLPR